MNIICFKKPYFCAMKFRRILAFTFLIFSFPFLVGTILQIGSSFFQKEEQIRPHPRENFDPTLIRINNLNKLSEFVDSIAELHLVHPDSILNYVEIADSIVRMRFYHGFQNYKFSENFIANLSGKHIWRDIGAKVNPEHILEGRKAFCSQSSIVFQALLHKKGIKTRSVRMPNHFATEVLINGKWGYFDVSLKPVFKNNPRMSTNDLINNPDYLKDAYIFSFSENFLDKLETNFNIEHVRFDKINAFPARKMLFIHRVTRFLSYFGWILLLGFSAFLFRIGE